MQLFGKEINALGMGCWPIGGDMFHGAQSLGYTRSDDATSLKTIHAALDAGISLFDTAAAYGAGHSERLLGQALKDRSDALVATKIGMPIDEKTRQIGFDLPVPGDVMPAIDGCLRRLSRDRIDLLFLHQNEMEIEAAAGIFDEMERAVEAGKVRAFGWSTDFSDRTTAMAGRAGFVAVEHAMNVFFDAPRLQGTVRDYGLTALIRSPLAMGVLAGKYADGEAVPSDDIRAATSDWMEYFKDGRVNPDFLTKLEAVCALLTIDGRTLVQGALGWIWAKGAQNLPVPGARNVAQIEGIAGALAFGALPDAVMAEIETLIAREPADAPERSR